MSKNGGAGALRRREILQPLDSYQERNLEESDPFTTVYISPCQIQVSNDPYKPIPVEDLVPCNLTLYECPNLHTNVLSTINLTVAYDFELYFKTGSDFTTSLTALEGSQLQHVASVSGLLDCSSAYIFARSGKNRFLESSEILTSSEQAALVAVSSDPKDRLDPNHSECVIPVESSITSRSTCVPIKGSLTATVDSSATATVQDSLVLKMMKVIRQGMQDDVYVTGNIEKVSFIGSRSAASNSFAPDSIREDDREAQNSGLSGVGIAFVCIGSVLFVGLIAIFIRKRHMRKVQERNMAFHDATLETQKPYLDQGDAPIQGHHSRCAPGAENGIEGAYIPGSLANKDELALKPDPSANMKTGDLPIDDGPVVPYTPPRKGVGEANTSGDLTLEASPDQVDFLADTLSFDSSEDVADNSVDDERAPASQAEYTFTSPEENRPIVESEANVANQKKDVPDMTSSRKGVTPEVDDEE